MLRGKGDDQQLYFKHLDFNFLKYFGSLLVELPGALSPNQDQINADIHKLKTLQAQLRSSANLKNQNLFIVRIDSVEKMLNDFSNILDTITDELKSPQARAALEKHMDTYRSLREQVEVAFKVFRERVSTSMPAPASVSPTPKSPKTQASVDRTPKFEALYQFLIEFTNNQLKTLEKLPTSPENIKTISSLKRINELATEADRYEVDTIGKTLDVDITKNYIEEMFGILKSMEAPPSGTNDYVKYSNALGGVEDAFNKIRAYKQEAFESATYKSTVGTNQQPVNTQFEYSLKSQLNDLIFDLNSEIVKSTEKSTSTLPYLKELLSQVLKIHGQIDDDKTPDWKSFERDVNTLHARAKASSKTFGMFGKALPDIEIFTEALSLAKAQQEKLSQQPGMR